MNGINKAMMKVMKNVELATSNIRVNIYR